MSSGAPLVPDGALAAALLATSEGGWSAAIKLWRDIFRTGQHDSLAAGCMAEAAWHVGHNGIFDHMISHCTDSEALLSSLKQQSRTPGGSGAQWKLGNWTERLAEQIDRFRTDHPLGHLCPDQVEELYAVGDRRVGAFTRMRAPRSKDVQAVVDGHIRAGDAAALAGYGKELVDRAAAPDALHWVILGLSRLEGEEASFDRLRRAFASYPLKGVERPMADARLYRGLGYPAVAQMILRDALETASRAGDRAKIRRRLARLAAENDRWLDDRDILTDTDFPGDTQVRAALREINGPDGTVPTDPLGQAFQWLLDRGALDADRYEAENRLLMVGNTLGCGGMERILARSYRHFSASSEFDQVDLALLDFADGEASAFYAAEAGVTADEIILLDRDGTARMPCALLPGSWKARAQTLYDHIRTTKPRVIHAWNDLTGLLSAFAGLAAGCPKVIIHFHHAPGVPQSGRAEQISSYPEIYRQLRVRPEVTTVFCAEAAAKGYAQWWHVDQDERFRVIYNGFDWDAPVQEKSEAKKKLGLAPDAPVIGTVFRFSDVKQPMLWAEAAMALAEQRSDACFLMVGDGPMQEAVAERFSQAGLADRLIMPGRVDNVADYLAAMELFWLTSKTEGLPNVLIEAQFSNVPVIAFDVGGASETFLPGTSGILVDADDVEALVDQTIHLLGDRARLAAMAQAGRRNALQSFSADAFFDRLSTAYTER